MGYGPTSQINQAQSARFKNFAIVGNVAALDCSSSSASTVLPTLSDGSPSTDVIVINSGSVKVFIAFGTTAPTVVAPVNGTAANGFPVLPGQTIVFDKGVNTYIGGITATGTATIYIAQGIGS